MTTKCLLYAGVVIFGELELEKLNSNLTFSEALEHLKAGAKVARSDWNGMVMWLSLVEVGHYDVGSKTVGAIDELLPWIGVKTADNKFVPWLASQTDVLAEDWLVLE